MARPRQLDPEEVLDRATHAFWQRGYPQTSIDDLVNVPIWADQS